MVQTRSNCVLQLISTPSKPGSAGLDQTDSLQDSLRHGHKSPHLQYYLFVLKLLLHLRLVSTLLQCFRNLKTETF